MFSGVFCKVETRILKYFDDSLILKLLLLE